MSRKLRFLDDSIGRVDISVGLRHCFYAQRAIYYGRKGETERGLADINAIKSAAVPHMLTVIVMRNLAEGVIDFYCSNGLKAIDKAMRAYSLASSGALISEQALSAAWLAHFLDSEHDIRAAARFANEALLISAVDAHDTRARAGLVVAQNLGIAGRPDLAAGWYTSVLRHANVVGDELTVSALMFNRTLEEVARWRQSKLQPDLVETAFTNAATAASSASNFDKLIENHGLENLNPLLMAQILSLNGSYQQAVDIYSTELPRENYALRMQADFVADQSLCLLHLGRTSEAQQTMELALQKLLPETHPDDRAATHSRAAILFAKVGDSVRAEREQRAAARLWIEYSRLQLSMVELFSRVPIEVDPA